MLPLAVTGRLATPSFVQTTFDRIRMGDVPYAITGLNDSVVRFNTRADLVAAYSTDHDTVAEVFLPRTDLAVKDWSLGGTTFFQDRTDGVDKVSMMRQSPSEPVEAGTVQVWENAYRIFRVPDAATRLSEVDISGVARVANGTALTSPVVRAPVYRHNASELQTKRTTWTLLEEQIVVNGMAAP
jgi:hypothetical protein